jgi:hypothetical protein
MGLVEHLEARLGLITDGWSKDPDGRPRQFGAPHSLME